jgi:undecaprenyl-diphosphatase
MFEIDAAITRWINNWAGSGGLADHLLVWISSIGVPCMILAVALQWWSGESARQHNRHVLLAAGFSFLVGQAMNQIILLMVHRMRPYDAGLTHLLIAPSADPSFPSDHATAAISIAAMLVLHRFRLAWVFMLSALLIAFSRVFIGTHYVSDVLGGAVTALVAVALVQSFFREGTRLDRVLTGIL